MEKELNTYSSAALAYIGDCALEICVREYLIKEKGISSSAKLNKEALRFVKASCQAEAMKNILMFETGNRVALVSHSTALTCLLSAWCEVGHNYDDEIILSYGDETIVDGHWTAPMVYKVVFDGMNVLSIEYINFEE